MQRPRRVKGEEPITDGLWNSLVEWVLRVQYRFEPPLYVDNHGGVNTVRYAGGAGSAVYKILAIAGASGIPAASGNTPGSGSVTLYSYPGSGAATSGATVTAYHWMTKSPVGANNHIILEQDDQGRYWVVAEDCS